MVTCASGVLQVTQLHCSLSEYWVDISRMSFPLQNSFRNSYSI